MLMLLAYIPMNLCGQPDYNRHIELMTQVNTISTESSLEEALQLVRSNADMFQQDEITKFWYDWLNGVLLYRLTQHADARPYLESAIAFINSNRNEFTTNDIINYLPVYYFLSDVDYMLGKDKDDIIYELSEAKAIYEYFNSTDNPIYAQIKTDLISLQENIPTVAVDAINNYLAKNYQSAIPLIQHVINYSQTYRPTEYIQLTNWIKLLAMSYGDIGDYNNAEKYYLMAFDLLESKNLQAEKVYRLVLDALGVMYSQVQNYEKANEFNGRAKMLFEKALDFGDDYVRCLCNGAIIKNTLGYSTLARMYLDVALRQAKTNLSDTTAISPALSGLEQYVNKHIDTESIDRNYFIQVRILPYVMLLSTSSVIYLDLGYYSEAVRTVKEAISIAEEYDLKTSLPYNNLAILYLYESKYSQAAEWSLKSYAMCRTPYEHDEIGMNSALSLYLSNDSSTAQYCAEYSERMRKNIKEMFAFMSCEERFAYWKHYENYLPWINLMIYDAGNPEYFGTIYDNILETKGLLLRSTNAIRDAIVKSGDSNDHMNFAKISQLKQQLVTEEDAAKIDSISKEIEILEKQLTRSVSSYADFKKSHTISWENVRDALSDDEIAIEFYNIPLVRGLDSVQTMDGEPRYCAVTLKKGYQHPHIIPLCKESEISNLENYDYYETDSIYQLIWHPLEDELQGIRTIYFSADRELHKIGIEYSRLADGSRIDDKYNMYRLSSTRILAEGKPSSHIDTAVLYGGLCYDLGRDALIAESRSGEYHSTKASRAVNLDDVRYGVKDLPGTKIEIEAIAKDFEATNSSQCIIITDVAGTEESFRALANKSIDIIHLATHGFYWTEEETEERSYVNFISNNKNKNQSFEDKALLRSGLLFSGANIGLRGEPLPDDVEDGVLTAQELSNMNLGNVDMVVMSACQSGLGETTGEGVFGLQRGFKLAGANTLLMSLWKVDDGATCLLMTEFYRHYLSGKSKRESLHLAQQTLRNSDEYSDPSYWAAFILLDAIN